MFVNNQLQIKETLGNCSIFAAIGNSNDPVSVPIAAIFGGLKKTSHNQSRGSFINHHILVSL